MSAHHARSPLPGALCAFATVVCLILPAMAAAQPEQIAPGVYRLSGVEETLPSSELQPLQSILRQAEVVGLGEASHTTRGFSRAKFRLFKYLVERAGFRVFGFESPWIDTERVARYVETCEGSADDAIKGLFGVWQNESVRDLVEWMCQYNQTNPEDPLALYGFDHQQGWNDARALQALLVGFGLAEDNNRVAWLSECEGARSLSAARYFANRQVPVRLEGHQHCMTALNRGWRFLTRRGPRLVANGRIGARDLAWARIHLVGLRAWQEQMFYFESDPPRSFEARDAGMAYIAQEIRDLLFPGAKTALWAHNAHLASGGKFLPQTLDMGYFLKEDLGNRYEAIGLIALETAIDWPGVGCGGWESAATDSVEAQLAELEEPYLLVDLDFPGAESPVFDPDRNHVLNGSLLVPREEFRALVYMDRAEAMIPIGRSACR